MQSALNSTLFVCLATILLVGNLAANGHDALEEIDSSGPLKPSLHIAMPIQPALAGSKLRLRMRGAEASSNLRLPGQRHHRQQTLYA